jgi:hypothetical protein
MSRAVSEFQVDFEWLEPAGAAPELRYWYCVSEQILGAREASCTVETAASGVQALLRHEGARRDAALMKRPVQALYDELSVGLMVDFDAAFEPAKDWQRYLRFRAMPADAGFSGWSAFVVEDDEHARFIWRAPGRGAKPSEVYLSLGAFDAALRAFQAELESHLRQRRSVPPASGARLRGPAREVG